VTDTQKKEGFITPHKTPPFCHTRTSVKRVSGMGDAGEYSHDRLVRLSNMHRGFASTHAYVWPLSLAVTSPTQHWHLSVSTKYGEFANKIADNPLNDAQKCALGEFNLDVIRRMQCGATR